MYQEAKKFMWLSLWWYLAYWSGPELNLHACTLKVVPIGFTAEVDMKCERKQGIKNDSSVSDEISIPTV